MRRPTWPDAAALLVVLLGLALRLREPLSSPIIGAEDPYLRMSNVWDFVQGRGLFKPTYPPGFSILLAPFALMGPEVFYWVGRFLPAFWGAAEVAGVYALCRAYLRPSAGLVGALVVALMPENIFRTNLLFPTALDLALLPWLFLLALRASEGSRAALVAGSVMLLVMLITHPWVVALVAPALAMLALSLGLDSKHRRRVAPVAAGAGVAGIALVGVLSFLPGTWNPTSAFFENAGPRLVELVQNPASLFPLPEHVNLPIMLTWTAMALALAGAGVALWRRERLDLLALVWSAFILPFVLVDWFDVWFIPHRSVAYLSVGVAILAALPFDAIARMERVPRAARVATVGAALLVVLALMLPPAMALGPWYRLYDDDDYEAWHDVAAHDPAQVIAGSWQAAEGYRAITGELAIYNPSFFEDGALRESMLRDDPDTIVLIDDYARQNGHPRGFLDGWEKIGEWDDGRIKAYRPW